ncbi:WLM-domain-containing protein [Lentinus tigrinus ALCF2SS1-6]|uniref:WLM-domain-containing protein n=1 Tax=Lentinus tigrinus ALCF2SS1-6 TaxID=1328759 RepID=A0A5C2SA16_9APHY|nr:WLM-domain-containing protein [Lentinus tigrinus ALCF2SS1-6]
MVHVRLNEREANPNPHINFITPLKMMDSEVEEQARQLLRALAAQVRPIMKAHGFVVNSLEEYEHNQVFAGRNWNNGEVIELVLRGAGGNVLPTSWLLSTLCHELAHIKHMNHGPAFQALWTKLRNEVRDLQSKGYYGDGYWSSGTRLADSARMTGQGLEAGDLPEYMCGGAQSRTRPTALRRRKTRRQTGPSNHTGAQTAKKRKAGSRVTAKGLFQGTGRALDEDIQDDEQKKAGAGFRKKAGSKRAREERALAAERRLLALQGKDKGTAPRDESDDDEDSDYECAPETDQDRRRTMLDSADKSELDGMKAWQRDYSSDFIFPPVASSSRAASPPEISTLTVPTEKRSKHTSADLGIIELSSDEEEKEGPRGCDVQLLPQGGTAASSSAMPLSKGKQREPPSVASGHVGKGVSRTSSSVKTQQKLPYGNLVQDEIQGRKKESLGMVGPGKRLGGTPSDHGGLVRAAPRVQESFATTSTSETSWTCQVCTFQNEPVHLACSACATPRGESMWAGNPV